MARGSVLRRRNGLASTADPGHRRHHRDDRPDPDPRNVHADRRGHQPAARDSVLPLRAPPDRPGRRPARARRLAVPAALRRRRGAPRYTPWLFPATAAHGAVLRRRHRVAARARTAIAVTPVDSRRDPRRDAVAHTAPALVLTGMIVATALLTPRDSRRSAHKASPRARRPSPVPGAIAAVVASPFLLPLALRYGFHVTNRLPGSWVDDARLLHQPRPPPDETKHVAHHAADRHRRDRCCSGATCYAAHANHDDVGRDHARVLHHQHAGPVLRITSGRRPRLSFLFPAARARVPRVRRRVHGDVGRARAWWCASGRRQARRPRRASR